VTVAIQSGTGGTLGGTTTVNAVAGVATFSGLSLAGTVGTNYVLRFSGSGLTVDTGNMTVTPGAATQLALTTAASRRSVRWSADNAAGVDDPRRAGEHGDVIDGGGDGGDPVGNGWNAGRNDDGQCGRLEWRPSVD
jgi:hypothetical protein